MSEFQVARAGAFDDITIYALADGSRLKVWDGPEPPDPELVNLWLDPSDEILKRYDVDDGWTDAGIVGATGEQGPQGERGEKGDTGERGPGGEKGETGARGEIGPRGLRGQQGDAGIPGPKGEIGSRGDTGERGPKGDKGERGERGQRGPRGYSVLSGSRDPEPEDGRDNDFWINIQTALIFGPKTDGEWGQGASIRGPMGPRGLTGSVGPQGPQGETGPQGPQGEPGSGDGGGPVDWSDITFDDGRPEYGGEQLALWSDRELEEDSRDESDPITSYPSGISIMPVSAEADWNGFAVDGVVRTERSGNLGWQEGSFSGVGEWRREWAGGTWGSWFYYATQGDIDNAIGTLYVASDPFTQYLLESDVQLEEDSRDLNSLPADYPIGESVMATHDSATEDTFAWWFFDGHVLTVRDVDGDNVEWVRQEFHYTSDTIFGPEWRTWDNVAEEWNGWRKILSRDNADTRYVNVDDVQLAEDSRAETDPITAYPSGISIMPVSALAEWNGYTKAGTVLSIHGENGGGQTLYHDDGWSEQRWWNADSDDWTAWSEPVFAGGSAYANLAANTVLLPPDSLTEPAAITDYLSGFTIMPVSAGENWGPNTGEAGHVLIEHNGSTGKQTFVVPSTETSYVRYYTSSAWGSWSSGSGSSDAATLEGEDGAYYLDRTNHTGTQALGTITGHDKAAHDALDIDADTLDGHDTSYFATASGLSDHLADTTDAHDASAISYLGSTNLAATEVEAALDELDTEKVPTGRTISTTAPLTGGGDLSANRTLAVSTATEAAEGVSERATQAETDTGTDDVRYVSPAKLKNTTALDSRYYTETESDTLLSAKAPTARTISTTAPLTGGGDLSANRTLAVSQGTETAQGVLELATDAETQTGTDTARAITPANLAARTATETRTGVVELATDAETQTGTDTARAITPANLAARTATETRTGVAELATQAETDTGTDDVRIVTPLKLKTTTALDSRYYTETEADTLLSAKTPTARTISTTAPLTGGGDLSANRTLAVSAGSETAQGVLELATDAETQTGTDTARAITPANLAARTATETRSGIAELATQAETDTGTDDARIVTPLKLATNPRVPTQGENDALVGTSGTASSTNKYVTDADSRNTNARTPTTHATSHQPGGSDAMAVDAVAATGSLRTLGTGAAQAAAGNHTHNASAIPFSPTGTVAATDVQTAIAEVASEAAAFSLTEVEKDLGSYAVRSGSFQITGLSGLTTGRHVLIRQASGPYTGKGNLADEAEMDQVSVTGKTTSATAIQCYWTSPTPVVGNFKFAYAVG